MGCCLGSAPQEHVSVPSYLRPCAFDRVFLVLSMKFQLVLTYSCVHTSVLSCLISICSISSYPVYPILLSLYPIGLSYNLRSWSTVGWDDPQSHTTGSNCPTPSLKHIYIPPTIASSIQHRTGWNSLSEDSFPLQRFTRQIPIQQLRSKFLPHIHGQNPTPHGFGSLKCQVTHM